MDHLTYLLVDQSIGKEDLFPPTDFFGRSDWSVFGHDVPKGGDSVCPRFPRSPTYPPRTPPIVS